MLLYLIIKWFLLFCLSGCLLWLVYRRRRNAFPIILLLCPAAGFCFQSDTPQYNIHHFTDENGLPQNSVKSIAADADGFIWLATENGLVRFDGHRFLSFSKENLPVSSSRMLYIKKDPAGVGIFAVNDRGEILEINQGMASLPDHSFTAFDNSFTGFRINGGKFENYVSNGLPALYKDILSIRNYLLPVDSVSAFVVTSDSVAFRKQKQKIKSFAFPHASFWNFFTVGKTLYYLDEKGNAVSSDSGSPARKVQLTGDILGNPAYRLHTGFLQLFWNTAGSELFIGLDETLYVLKPSVNGDLETRLLLQNFDLESNFIISIHYDTLHKRIYLGSPTNGLFVLDQKKFRVFTSGYRDQSYYSQTHYGQNSILTPKGNIIGPSTHGTLPAIAKNYREDQYSITRDDQGNIWVKEHEVLSKYDKDGDTLLYQWYCHNDISQLYKDRAGNIWIGTRFDGLYRITPSETNSAPQSVVNSVKEITYLQQETDDRLWVGTDHGLYRLQLSTRQLDTIPELTGKYIRSIPIARPGEIWITTAENGCFLYWHNKLVSFPVDRQKYLLSSHCMIEDKNGYFWITTNKGLFQASRDDLLAYAEGVRQDVFYLYYGKENGFNTNEFNGGCEPCALEMSNGNISLPSLNGLIWFNPASLHAEQPGNAVFIDKIEVDQAQIPRSDTIRLSRNIRLIKLSIATPYAGDEYNVQIDFALVKDNNRPVWLQADDNRYISISSPASGNYQLIIRKHNGFGKANYSYKTINLVVPPAFYETAWFYVLLILSLLLLFWAYTKFRLGHEKKKNKALEERISEHTAELQETLSALIASEKNLQRQTRLQERLITAITHDIKSPLRYMSDAAKRLFNESVNKPGMEQVQEQAKMLFESGTKMYLLTDNLLQYIKLHSRNGSIAMEAFNLFELVKEKVAIFRDIALVQGTHIINQVPPDLQISSNARLLGVIIHNLLDNATKVTYEGIITVAVASKGLRLILAIQDTGPGMRPELVGWCNAEAATGKDYAPEHMGLGLLIVKELVTLVNGHLWVESSPGKGTTVKIIIENGIPQNQAEVLV